MINIAQGYEEYLGSLRPMRGTCLALFEADATKNGQIDRLIIPTTAKIRNRILYHGLVIAEYPILEPLSLATLAGLVGRQCLFNPVVGQLFMWNNKWLGKYELNLEHIIAVFYEEEWIDLKNEKTARVSTVVNDGGGIKRCRFCKSSGKYNIMLDGDGVCPICKCKENGKKHIPYRHIISDGETEKVIELPNEPRLSEEFINLLGGATCQRQ